MSTRDWRCNIRILILVGKIAPLLLALALASGCSSSGASTDSQGTKQSISSTAVADNLSTLTLSAAGQRQQPSTAPAKDAPTQYGTSGTPRTTAGGRSLTTCELLTTAAASLLDAGLSPVELTNKDPAECLYANENRSSVVDLLLIESYGPDQLTVDSKNPFPQQMSRAVTSSGTQVNAIPVLGPDAFHASKTSTMSTKPGAIFQADIVEWVSCDLLLKLGTTGQFSEAELQSTAQAISQKLC